MLNDILCGWGMIHMVVWKASEVGNFFFTVLEIYLLGYHENLAYLLLLLIIYALETFKHI